MTDAGGEFPPVEDEAEYELRFTRRALDDLGCPADVAPGDLDAVEASTQYREIVRFFRDQRTASSTGTGGSMRNVGRADIYSLHGPVGQRACTWFDEESKVCWFLGWVAQHDYTEFETRAVNDELLPSLDDETVLEVERETLDFEHRVGPGLRQMLGQALGSPGVPIRRTVGSLLQLDVTVEAVVVDGDRIADVYITTRVPPLDDPPPGWPGRELPEHVARLAVGDSDCDIDFPTEVPGDEGAMRRVEFGAELAVVIRDQPL